jgi:2-keto-4-pentenoate hydratase/2-oxohepta-3-ene-1,7-dioic acid hydratase in catechol pathway
MERRFERLIMNGVRLSCAGGRAVLEIDGRLIDIADRSGGRFAADPMAVLDQWDAFSDWAREQAPNGSEATINESTLGVCVPRPRSVFGIGVNYRDHIEEAGMDAPTSPMVFTKFPSCLASPTAEIPLTSNRVDWEAELVVVIGQGGNRITAEQAMKHVAGYCVGQDISDRRQQFSDKPPQFSLGKSAKAYGPIGPSVVSLDSFADPHDLAISCEIDGERMQNSRTSQMLFGVPELIAYISRWCELAPGDLIFTGTPGGTGGVRDPRRYLKPGETITTEVERIGRIRNTCVEERT